LISVIKGSSCLQVAQSVDELKSES